MSYLAECLLLFAKGKTWRDFKNKQTKTPLYFQVRREDISSSLSWGNHFRIIVRSGSPAPPQPTPTPPAHQLPHLTSSPLPVYVTDAGFVCLFSSLFWWRIKESKNYYVFSFTIYLIIYKMKHSTKMEIRTLKCVCVYAHVVFISLIRWVTFLFHSEYFWSDFVGSYSAEKLEPQIPERLGTELQH